jgi:toxin ParE1/3/4
VKKAQVIWLSQALDDLEIIYDFIEEQSPLAAQRVITTIVSRTRQLETFPESGAVHSL